MPNKVEAVSSGTARIATFNGRFGFSMAEMTAFQLF
jgi:hypothetical protein